MGLKTGKGGVKDSLREQYEEAFGVHDNHEECFKSLGVAPQHAVICLDGNVLMRQIPEIVDREATDHLPERSENATLADVVEIVTKRILGFFRAASIVIVTFDEPHSLTLAKQDEQRKRDGADKEVSASADFKVNTDRYTLRDMKKAPCLNDLTKGRQARPRYSDEVFRQLKDNLGAFLRRSDKTLVVDGADDRGALRHIGSLRVPCISGAGRDAAAVAHWLSHYKHSGEGDLKLRLMYAPVVAAHANDAAPEGLRDIRVYSTWTIDTDDFGIQLIGAGQRDAAGQLRSPVKLFTAMYEPHPATKYKPAEPPTVLFCDVNALYGLILSRAIGSRLKRVMKETTAAHRANLMRQIVAGWMSLKCDYVPKPVPKLNFDRVMTVARAYASDAQETEAFGYAVRTRHDLKLLVERSIFAMYDLELRQRTGGAIRDGDSLTQASYTRPAAQAAWMLAYWSDNEITERLEEFCIEVDPETIVERYQEQRVRRRVRLFQAFAFLAFCRLAVRAKKRLAEGGPLRRSPRRAETTPPPSEQPRPKRRRLVMPKGNGWN